MHAGCKNRPERHLLSRIAEQNITQGKTREKEDIKTGNYLKM